MKIWQVTFLVAAALAGQLMAYSSHLPIIYLHRSPRSLLNTFPFNQRQHDHDHAHGHDHAHEDLAANANKQIRQGSPESTNDLQLGAIAAANEKCVEKVMMVEETQYDDAIECHHSYDKKCHTTYTTDYEPTQVEICDDNYVKECYIEYKSEAHNETVEVCNERTVRDCDKEGPTVCETVYDSECETHYHVHEVEDDTPDCKVELEEKCHDVTQGYATKQECSKWPKQVCVLTKSQVKKFTPETGCVKKPRQVCGPGPCPLVAGPKECHEEVKTIVQDVPVETCQLRPQRFCKHVTKLIPALKPHDNCVDVPREACVRVRTNPRKIQRPVIKKWCYVPTPESGLDNALERSARSSVNLTAGALDNDAVDDDASVSTLAPELDVALTEETPTDVAVASGDGN